MINLLPYDTKNEIRAARNNVTLMKYIFVILVGVAFLAVVADGIYTILMSTKSSAESVIQSNQSKVDAYTSSNNQAAALKNSLSNAKVILDQEIRYSEILTNIAALMPSGAVIENLNLTPDSFSKPTTLTIHAKSTDAALIVKDKFQVSPLFSNMSFVSIASGSASQDSGYPITAILNVTINKVQTQ
jgi:hypothetical protein